LLAATAFLRGNLLAPTALFTVLFSFLSFPSPTAAANLDELTMPLLFFAAPSPGATFVALLSLTGIEDEKKTQTEKK
jgi:hypothetical protein